MHFGKRWQMDSGRCGQVWGGVSSNPEAGNQHWATGFPGAAHPPSAMSTAKGTALGQGYNEMNGLIVGVGKNYCRKSQARCDECPLQKFLPRSK
jgi:hypothetical protein